MTEKTVLGHFFQCWLLSEGLPGPFLSLGKVDPGGLHLPLTKAEPGRDSNQGLQVNRLASCAHVFQVSKQGGILDVHNQVQQVRVAIAATSPGLPVPDVLLLARPVLLPQQLQPNLQHRYRPRARNRKFELTR